MITNVRRTFSAEELYSLNIENKFTQLRAIISTCELATMTEVHGSMSNNVSLTLVMVQELLLEVEKDVMDMYFQLLSFLKKEEAA